MANLFVEGDIVLGTVTYASITEDKKKQLILEIGFESDEKVLGVRPEDGTEGVQKFEGYATLFVGGDPDNEADSKRRGIARDAIENMTEVRLEDNWGAKGYQRLLPDHKDTLVEKIKSKKVMFIAREFNNRVLWNIHFPRRQPKGLTLASLRERMKASS